MNKQILKLVSGGFDELNNKDAKEAFTQYDLHLYDNEKQQYYIENELGITVYELIEE